MQNYCVCLATWWLSSSLTRSQIGSLWFKQAHAIWTPVDPLTTPWPVTSMAPLHASVQLTDRFVRSLQPPPPGKRSEVVDQVQPKLRLRVSDTGVKTWSIQKRVDGRKRRFTLGTYPTLSLSEAGPGRLRSDCREAIGSQLELPCGRRSPCMHRQSSPAEGGARRWSARFGAIWPSYFIPRPPGSPSRTLPRSWIARRAAHPSWQTGSLQQSSRSGAGWRAADTVLMT